MIPDVIANFNNQRADFEQLLNKDCNSRVLLLRGESGSGKSTLLKCCHKSVGGKAFKLFIDLKPGSVSVADIFSRAALTLGIKHLPNFHQQLISLHPASAAQIDHNEIEGNGNFLCLTLNTGTPAEREDRQIHLTDAWIRDMRGLDRILLMSVDTYEKSTTEVKDWIHRVLARLPYAPPLRIAIAGQEVPDSDTGEDWAGCCSEHNLCGVREAKHWLPVVEAMGRTFPPGINEPLDYLAGICDVCNGLPSQIIEFIKQLPKVNEHLHH